MEQKTLFRTKDAMLGGVCGGVAEYFGIDKSVVRIAFVLLMFAGLLGFFAYLVMWIIIPLEKES